MGNSTSDTKKPEEYAKWEKKMWDGIFFEIKKGSGKIAVNIVYKHLVPLLTDPEVPKEAKLKAQAFTVAVLGYHNSDLIKSFSGLKAFQDLTTRGGNDTSEFESKVINGLKSLFYNKTPT